MHEAILKPQSKAQNSFWIKSHWRRYLRREDWRSYLNKGLLLR